MISSGGTIIIPQNAKEKLQRYHREAYLRGLSQHYWRKQLARQLLKLASKLEPQTKGGGQPYPSWRLITKIK